MVVVVVAAAAAVVVVVVTTTTAKTVTVTLNFCVSPTIGATCTTLSNLVTDEQNNRPANHRKGRCNIDRQTRCCNSANLVSLEEWGKGSYYSILRLYRDSGKEHGNYYGLYRLIADAAPKAT